MLDMAPETLQTLSTLHPLPAVVPRRRASGAVDTRAPITAWDALAWAYGAEKVRFAGVGTPDLARLDFRRVSATGAACDRLGFGGGGGGEGRGSIAARASAHWDADVIDAWARGHGRDDYWLLVRAGEDGTAPQWDVDVPPGRLVPVLGKHGRPKMLLSPSSDRVIGCRVEQQGVPAHEVEAVKAAAKGRYARLVALLAALAASAVVDIRLERWCIKGIGIEPEPWNAIAAGA